MRARASFLCLTVAFALLVALARPSAAAPAPSAQAPYEINALLPLTGAGAFLGSGFVDALHAVERVVNKTGGVSGRPLKFVISDSTSSPPVSLQLMNGLIAKSVPVVIDGGPSAICNPSIAAVQAAGPVDYCLSSAVRPEPGSYAFSSGISSPVLTDVLVNYLRGRHWTRLALITSTDATGIDFDQQIARVLAARANSDIKLVAHEHFNISDISVAAQIARIKASDPQVIMTWSTGTPFGTVLHGIRDAGLNLPVTAVPSNQSFAEMRQYATVLPRDLFFPSARAVSHTGTGNGPVRDAQLAYYDAFKAAGTRPDFISTLAWDPAMIVVQAIRTVGPGATASQLRDYMLHLHSWAGINGIYDFRDGSQRGIGINACNVQRWDQSREDFVAVSRPGGNPL